MHVARREMVLYGSRSHNDVGHRRSNRRHKERGSQDAKQDRFLTRPF